MVCTTRSRTTLAPGQRIRLPHADPDDAPLLRDKIGLSRDLLTGRISEPRRPTWLSATRKRRTRSGAKWGILKESVVGYPQAARGILKGFRGILKEIGPNRAKPNQ